MATHSSILAWKIRWKEEPLNHGVAELDMTEHACTCISQSQAPPPLPLGSHKIVFYICDYFRFVDEFICILFFFKIPHISDIT